jgi:hypothetical protein
VTLRERDVVDRSCFDLHVVQEVKGHELWLAASISAMSDRHRD